MSAQAGPRSAADTRRSAGPIGRASARLRYFVRTALRGLRATPLTSAVAVATITVTLVLFGSFTLVIQNMRGLLERFGEDLRITVYLAEGVSDAQRAELAARVATVEGVQDVESVSREEALARFRRGVGARSGLLEGLDENPLPASLEISLLPERRTSEGARIVADSLDGLPGIAEIARGESWIAGYARALALVRGIALALGAVLALATLLIVANTIRLAVYARREELEILSLVGASRSFVAIPFLLEGALQGALGGALALGLLGLLFRLALPALQSAFTFVFGFATPAFLSGAEMLGLVCGGAALGLLGSATSLLGSWRR